MDKIHAKLCELYKDCKNYAPDIIFPDTHNAENILKYLTDICRNIYQETLSIKYINPDKFKFIKIKDIKSIKTTHRKHIIPFELILQCSIINIVEQLIYIKKLCINDKDGESKKTYIKSLLKDANDAIYEKDIIYIKLETLLKQSRNKIYKGVNHKFSSFFKFYEQFVFNETNKGYHTSISKVYPNLVYSLFNLDSLRESTYVQVYNLIPNTPYEKICDDIYNLYSNIYINTQQATASANLAEFIIAERMYGLKSFEEIIKRDISNTEKQQLAQIISYIRNFGFTPLHQYIIDNYTKDINSGLIYATLKSTTVIEKTMQTFINGIIKLLNISNEYKIESLLNNFIGGLYEYLLKINVNISYETTRFTDFELYDELMNCVEDNDFLSDELSLLDLNPQDLKEYINIISKRRRFGVSYYYKYKNDKKYKYESNEKYSQKKYIQDLYGISSEQNTDKYEMHKSYFHIGYRIKY
ncbi:MAG: hypothetical protein HFE49_07485 [Clostridia bacterium]|nr:hypothetical protein [Clostridia bacterium]